MSGLLSKVSIGQVELSNRVVLAPMTRARAELNGNANEIMADYYAQRASSGNLVITEASGIQKQGAGWYGAGMFYTQEHADSWKPVVEKVHKAGGKIALQLWHMGRQAHSDVIGEQPVSASDIGLEGEVTAKDMEKKPYEKPVPLTEEGINKSIECFAIAADRAINQIGFDFVEIHGANGYLIDQFIQTVSNKRTDKYGGSVENRLRFGKEVVEAVLSKVPKEKVAIRLSPNGQFGGMGSEDNIETFSELISWLGSKNLGYIHIMDGLGFGFHEKTEPFTLKMARDILNKVNSSSKIIGNVGYTKETAEKAIQDGDADLIAFGRPYMSNPDLPDRFEKDVPLREPPEYKYWWTLGLGAEGFTDWPTVDHQQEEKA